MNPSQCNVVFLKDAETMMARLSDKKQWFLCKKKRYQVKIQKASSQVVYYEGGEAGIVYNFLEDAMEPVYDTGFVVTGQLGEMWPIPESALKSYDVDASELDMEPRAVWTKVNGILMAAIQIPADIVFQVKLPDSGTVLNGNAGTFGHGEGDYILAEAERIGQGALQEEVTFQILWDKGLRIVNGQIFDRIYMLCEL